MKFLTLFAMLVVGVVTVQAAPTLYIRGGDCNSIDNMIDIPMDEDCGVDGDVPGSAMGVKRSCLKALCLRK
ncbi:hypothetical protein C8Q76DRAFT_719001 [Earliella scabrosa]|nr:hypothetical protein C8Q76DRAFT_719001 [Earliella scabrosa]